MVGNDWPTSCLNNRYHSFPLCLVYNCSFCLLGPILGHIGDGNFHSGLLVFPDNPQEMAEAKALANRMAEYVPKPRCLILTLLYLDLCPSKVFI